MQASVWAEHWRVVGTEWKLTGNGVAFRIMIVQWLPKSLHLRDGHNAQRSHAGPVMPSTARDGLPALADACG